MKMDYEVIIVGAGVIGLSIARALADRKISSVLVIEKEPSYGRGTSSRNSEVIHSGIYYPPNNNKTHYCTLGREKMYDFCRKYDINHSKCGKLVIAQSGQESQLEFLHKQAELNNVPEIYMMDKKEIHSIEPDVIAEAALFVGCSGILSAHELMSTMHRLSEDFDHDYLFMASVIDVDQKTDHYSLTVHGPGDVTNKVTTRWVINAAGLGSDILANLLLGSDKKDVPEIHYSKGLYFKIAPKWRQRIQHLIYPIPDEQHDSLGIHLCIDVGGDIKLGPSAEFLSTRDENYTVDISYQQEFYLQGKQYLSKLEFDDLSPDFAGIRPKLVQLGEGQANFYIKHEVDLGFPGLINLIGIDSPGLTSSIAIGDDVAEWISSEQT